jgi:hypothetical protein
MDYRGNGSDEGRVSRRNMGRPGDNLQAGFSFPSRQDYILFDHDRYSCVLSLARCPGQSPEYIPRKLLSRNRRWVIIVSSQRSAGGWLLWPRNVSAFGLHITAYFGVQCKLKYNRYCEQASDHVLGKGTIPAQSTQGWTIAGTGATGVKSPGGICKPSRRQSPGRLLFPIGANECIIRPTQISG